MPTKKKTDLDKEIESVKTMTTANLKKEFAEGLRIVRERLLRLSAIMQELDSRGVKVEADKNVQNLLRKIAAKRVDVDVVVRFAGRPYTLASVMALSVAEQRRLLAEDDESVDREVGRPKTGPRPSQPSLAKIAATLSPSDLADAILDMIRSSSDPKTVCLCLLDEAKKIAGQSKKRAS